MALRIIGLLVLCLAGLVTCGGDERYREDSRPDLYGPPQGQMGGPSQYGPSHGQEMGGYGQYGPSYGQGMGGHSQYGPSYGQGMGGPSQYGTSHGQGMGGHSQYGPPYGQGMGGHSQYGPPHGQGMGGPGQYGPPHGQGMEHPNQGPPQPQNGMGPNQQKPPLNRKKAISMLEELRALNDDLGADDSQSTQRIEQLLGDSEVNEDKCHEDDTEWLKPSNSKVKFRGQAKELAEESRRMQVELCMGIWERAMKPAMRKMPGKDMELVNEMLESMIEHNEKKDFKGPLLEMPYVAAQNGVLAYIEKKSGKSISHKTSKDAFYKVYNKWVYEPCGRLVDQLLPNSEKLWELAINNKWIVDELDPKLMEWAKKGRICIQLRGWGYASSMVVDFKHDTLHNLMFRPEAPSKGWFSG